MSSDANVAHFDDTRYGSCKGTVKNLIIPASIVDRYAHRETLAVRSKVGGRRRHGLTDARLVVKAECSRTRHGSVSMPDPSLAARRTYTARSGGVLVAWDGTRAS